MKRRLTVLSIACLLSLLLSGAGRALAAEWGTVKGRFVYAGKPPVQEKLTVTKDIEVCSKHNPVDESLVVADDGGLANVVVYIRPPRGKKLAVHPDYQKLASQEVIVDNLHCRFDPHIQMMWTEQKLAVKNSDPVGHNTKADCFSNPPFNVLIPAGATQEVSLTKEERLPVPVGCNIHPWMSGYLLVREDPYMAVSDKDGSFVIKNIPAGTHEFQFWQEKSGYLKNISFKGGKANSRGRAKIKVSSGDVDLGEIKVSPSLFSGK